MKMKLYNFVWNAAAASATTTVTVAATADAAAITTFHTVFERKIITKYHRTFI